MSERDVREIIGWEVKDVDGAMYDGGPTRTPYRLTESGPDFQTPTVDDLLDWLREQGWSCEIQSYTVVGWPNPHDPAGPQVWLMLYRTDDEITWREDERRYAEGNDLLTALDRAVRAVAAATVI